MVARTRHDDVVDQLDQLYAQAKRQILQNQSAITGLFPSNSREKLNASIKTSLWAASSIFALYLAYSKRVDNDKGKAHDLGQSVVKCMRGILFAWMRQSEKVESFKANQSPKHALHLKFDLHSGLANDADYPHLQIDVVSLYLIFLAEFIASGLDIIYCMDEVTFIQNLVYYVERAYRTPDFGNYEPLPQNQSTTTLDQMTNQIESRYSTNIPVAHTNNLPNDHKSAPNYSAIAHQMNHQTCNNSEKSLEIHATSIGMAKSALEAINGCNLFGGKGANWSIIYSDIDAHSRNRSIFETLLPRESRSKNTDSYLLATISWPCFATHDPNLYQSTKSKILRKLKGRYGLKRFLRDPYGTVISPERSVRFVSESLQTASSLPDMSIASSSSTAIESNNNNLVLTNTNPAHQQPATTPTNCNFRESSFSSTTSSSSLSLGEPPKSKQRKSSYIHRKNIVRNNPSSSSSTTINSPCLSCHQHNHTIDEAVQTCSILQRADSTLTRMSKQFEHIESEWPLFICFLIIDGIFKQDMEQVYENEKLLYERLLKVDSDHGDYLMPKYYYVPPELIAREKCHPDTVDRLASLEGSSSDSLYLTGQSILLITRLLLAGLVHPNELDPLRRHMPSHDRPKRIGRYSSFQAASSDLVVQTVLIAESIRLQAMMANYGIQTQTPLEVEPVQIWSSAQLVKVYEYLGVNEKLGLKGRPSRPIGALGTSKLYRICGQTILCYPLIFEVSDFYLAQDMLLLIDDIQNELNFIGRYWRMSGRPTVCIIIREEHLKDVHFRDLLDLLVQFKNGQLKKSGLRIKTGRLQNLISSSCIEHLDFLHLLPHEHLPQFKSFRQLVESPKQSLLNIHRSPSYGRLSCSRSSRARLGKKIASSSAAPNLDAIEESDASLPPNDDDVDEEDEQDEDVDLTGEAYGELDFHMSDPSCHKVSSPNLDSYSTLPCQTIDYYECYKDAPTWPNLIDALRSCNELGGQSQILAILWQREGPKYCVENQTVESKLERVSQQACHARNWSVVRYCSAVLKKSVESLSPWLTSILVNGKQISIGSGSNERIINNPLTPTEINQLIYSTLNTHNPCDAVLQQEIALYIGRLISTRPDYFEGILTIRVTNVMSAMRSYLNIKTNERKQSVERRDLIGTSAPRVDVVVQPQQELLDLRIRPPQFVAAPLAEPQASTSDNQTGSVLTKIERSISPSGQLMGIDHTRPTSSSHQRYTRNRRSHVVQLIAKPLESLSPSDVRKLLVKVLSDEESLPISDRRQLTGELCRVPKDFYSNVWSLLSCTNIGILIGGKILRSIPILTNMTQDDLNFALKVESLLSSIDDPKLRQVNVELLMSLHVILERNPEIKFESDPLDLDKIISISLDKFRSDHNRPDYGLKEYYTYPAQTTMLYTIRAVFDCLLPAKYKTNECRLS